MIWCAQGESPLQEYVETFASLIGDQRTKSTFTEILKGIVGCGCLVCAQIVRHSLGLSKVKHGAERVIRLAKGQSTCRSALAAEQLIANPLEPTRQALTQLTRHAAQLRSADHVSAPSTPAVGARAR